jgi:PAS domain S-box-containing protein
MSAPASPSRWRWLRRPAWAVLVLMLVVTAWVWLDTRRAIRREDEARFVRQVDRFKLTLEARLGDYEQVLRGAQGLVSASDSVERHEWRSYVQKLGIEKTYRSLSGIAYVQHVPRERLPDFLQEMAEKNKLPNLKIEPPGEREEYAILKFFEPEAQQAPQLGYDLATVDNVRPSLEYARDSGLPIMAARIQVFPWNPQAGDLTFILPVYSNLRVPRDEAERRELLDGWILAPVRSRELLESIGQDVAEDLRVQVYAGAAINPATLIYDSGQRVPPGEPIAAPQFEYWQNIAVGKQDLLLTFSTLPRFEAKSDQGRSTLVLAVGLLINLLLFTLILQVDHRWRTGAQLWPILLKITVILAVVSGLQLLFDAVFHFDEPWLEMLLGLLSLILLSAPLIYYWIIKPLDKELGLRIRAAEEMAASLRASQERYRDLFDHVPIGVYRTTPDGRLLMGNPALLRLLCFDSVEEASARNLEGEAEAAGYPRDQFKALMAAQGEVRGLESVWVRRDRSVIFVRENAKAIRNGDGEVLYYEGTLEDITERKRVERRLAAQHAVTRVLAESATLDEATPKLLKSICESVGWQVGAIWYVDEAAQVLRCVDTWYAPNAPVAEFVQITRHRTFERGIGLPGRVWATGQPAWIANVVQDTNFPRAPIADRCGLHGAFAFPIRIGGRVAGVVEFFNQEIAEPDGELLSTLGALGSQVGQFIERRRAEEELRAAGERLLRQQAALIRLTRSSSLRDEDVASVFRQMTELAAETLGVQRVSIWRYATDHEAIHCVDLYELDQRRHTWGLELPASKYPTYFEALSHSELIAAHDAQADPRTSEFTESYLRPQGITSMMDVPIYLFGKLEGVLCHEHVGPLRTWLPDEQVFGNAVANLISLAIEQWERRRMEFEVQRAQANLSALIENTREAIWSVDRHCRLITFNSYVREEVESVYGVRVEVGMSPEAILPANEAAYWRSLYERALTGERFSFEHEYERGGESRSLVVSLNPIQTEDRITGVAVFTKDLTDRKKSELALRDSQALYQSLVRSLPLNVMRKDLQGRFTFANEQFCKTVGHSLQELLGKTDHDFFPAELATKYARDDRGVIETGKVFEDVEEHIKPNGERIYVQVLKAPVYDARDNIIGTQGIFWDCRKPKKPPRPPAAPRASSWPI